MSAGARLPRSFFARPTLTVARELLGAVLVHEVAPGDHRRGRVVEVEAYVGLDDRASHASRGPTPRNRPMFGPAGHAYVYLVYGMHHCLNLVTEATGFPAAVLIRALEPAAGVAARTDGPGRLCRALAIDLRANGADLCAPGAPLYLERRRGAAPPVAASPRVGVDYAGAWAARPWRLFVPGNPHVSRAAGFPR